MSVNAEGEILLNARGLCKSFGSVQALAEGSVTLRRGEIMALVGDNGAGKSTLIKCLSGVLSPDGGVVNIGGEERSRLSIREARRLGIAVVYQDLALVDALDVASNIWLGLEPVKGGIFLDRRRMVRDARALLERLSINLKADGGPVGRLSGGQRQAVAVARAIAQGGRILILDEPSAAMGVRESEHLLEIMCSLRKEGMAMLWISHNLPQILQAADRVTVMRGGRTVREAQAAGLNPLDLAGWMAGALT